jgi:hypothetical protein
LDFSLHKELNEVRKTLGKLPSCHTRHIVHFCPDPKQAIRPSPLLDSVMVNCTVSQLNKISLKHFTLKKSIINNNYCIIFQGVPQKLFEFESRFNLNGKSDQGNKIAL